MFNSKIDIPQAGCKSENQMDNIAVDDINVNMDDPEGGCIVQADDPQMVSAAAFDGSSGPSGNNSWYWSSMLKLMEQGAAPSSTSSYSTEAHVTPTAGQQPAAAEHTPPPSASSPSSSSVHDQPIDMLPQNNAINASDPDSSVWGQEFLNGPIGENKAHHHLGACSEDGLHELLLPRTVLELLFSDQLKLEQMPSWPDILQQTLSGAGTGSKSFGFPATQLMASDKNNIMSGAGQDNVNMDTAHLDMKFPQYLQNYSGVDDRLSSSTASSTLSDNAIDQWAPATAPAGSSAALIQCEHGAMQAHQQAAAMQQIIDPTVRIKQEYMNHVPSPPYDNISNNNYGSHNYLHQQRAMASTAANAAAGNGFDHDSMMMDHDYEQKPNHAINKLWSSHAAFNANHDPLSPMNINHKHHIYESITAANFSHNLRQVAALNGNGYNFGVGDSHTRIIAAASGGAAGAHLQNSNNMSQLPQQLAKKSRPFHEGGGAASTAGLQAADHEATTSVQEAGVGVELELDSKPGAGGGITIISDQGAANMQQLHMVNNKNMMGAAQILKQQQLCASSEYNSNFKRSRTDHQSTSTTTAATAAPPASTTSTNNSASSLKSQPVRKEKLSERITTLQQLVSPFGKTDTASVLLEAIGYIKFLQDQVQALSSPYFKSPSNQSGDRNHIGDEGKPDLRSRGLCLVPLSCTMQVANDNGADYWFGGAFR